MREIEVLCGDEEKLGKLTRIPFTPIYSIHASHNL
jgi:hypothetical protein